MQEGGSRPILRGLRASWERSHLGCHAWLVLAGVTPALLEKVVYK
jgi:hypothetical protein